MVYDSACRKTKHCLYSTHTQTLGIIIIMSVNHFDAPPADYFLRMMKSPNSYGVDDIDYLEALLRQRPRDSNEHPMYTEQFVPLLNRLHVLHYTFKHPQHQSNFRGWINGLRPNIPLTQLPRPQLPSIYKAEEDVKRLCQLIEQASLTIQQGETEDLPIHKDFFNIAHEINLEQHTQKQVAENFQILYHFIAKYMDIIHIPEHTLEDRGQFTFTFRQRDRSQLILRAEKLWKHT